jgi:hypothetical protein
MVRIEGLDFRQNPDEQKSPILLGIGLLGYYVFNLITTLLAKTHHPRRPKA